MIKNAYVHIPFCRSKCKYCSFVSFTDLNLKEAYLNALNKEILAEYKGEKLNTLYFGGGTPSLLSINEIKILMQLFNFAKDAEITFEANPDDINFEYLAGLKKLGINRLSLGCQTFDNEILKTIGRRHNSGQTELAVSEALKAGIDNISIDLIYGLPGVNSGIGVNVGTNGFLKDLKKAVSLNIKHISLYGLKIDEGCEFYKNPPINLPDLDLQADMYLAAVETLKNNSFEHYEISNFSKKGFESKHNLNYWENKPYYGFGCAASGYIEGIRFENQPDLAKYIKNPLSKTSVQKLSKQEQLEEAIFLGFRKIAGINIEEINKIYDIDFNRKYSKILEKYADFFVKTQQGWALNIQGILISNNILSEFIDKY